MEKKNKYDRKNKKLTRYSELKDIVIDNTILPPPENKKTKENDKRLFEVI